jgi:hypothetical protein
MLTTKLLKNTFGAKIKPYGFQYKGFKHRRWTFQFEINNKIREIVVQKDPGSFQLELNFPCGNHKVGELFGDLKYHFTLHKNDEELENLLNTLGDHFVKRLIPRLPELCIPECAYQDTKEMHLKLYQEKDKLINQFLLRHQINSFYETDIIMQKLLQDAEWIKDKPFEEVENILVEMAAVYGTVIIQNIGGEWGELEQGYIKIKELPSTTSYKSPLGIICRCCQKGGGKALAFDYAEIESKYRYWVAEQYRKYGKNWKPFKPVVKTNKNLLTEEIVRETIGEKTKNMGFVCGRKLVKSYFLELENNDCDMTIQITEDEWQRNGFCAALYKGRGGYLYSDYFYYKDEAELCMQLNYIGDKLIEIINQDRISPLPLFSNLITHADYITPEIRDQFLIQRENLAKQFRDRNRLSKNSEEYEILQCITEHLDALVGIDFEVCKEELLELGAVYGDLIIRQIGGIWYEYEDWRMKQIHSGIYNVPAIDRIFPHYDIVEFWENGGSQKLIWSYQEYKWRYEEWKRLCDLAGISI